VLPDLGEGLTEAEIVSWLVQPGDMVVVDQPVVEVESAKSTVELPSPFAGRVEKLHAAAGDTVLTGGVLITVAEVATEVAATADIVPGTALRSEATDAASGAVLVGYGTREARVRTAHAPGTRFGRRDASSVLPCVSASGFAKPSNVSSRPSAQSTVTNAPSETPGRPSSSALSVFRLRPALAASSAIDMPRRTRATRTRWPRLSTRSDTWAGSVFSAAITLGARWGEGFNNRQR